MIKLFALRRFWIPSLPVLIFGLLMVGQSHAATNAGVVKGLINYCGSGGVAGMQIFVPGRQFVVITGDDGKFLFDQLPEGEYSLFYLYKGKIIDHRTDIYVFENRVSDIGEIALCDSAAKGSSASVETKQPVAAPVSVDTEVEAPANVSSGDGCTEGNVIKISNGVGECKGASVRVISCNKGFSDCDGDATNGCETDIMNNNEHCGSCDNECAANEFCTQGDCS